VPLMVTAHSNLASGGWMVVVTHTGAWVTGPPAAPRRVLMDGMNPYPAGRSSRASTHLMLLVLVPLLALLAAVTPPAGADAPSSVPGAVTGAAGGWTAAVAAVEPGCHPAVEGTAAAAAGGGTVRGFAHWATVDSDCRDDRAWYFQGRRGHWSQSRSPYRGEILAVAVDRTATYLLYWAAGPSGLLDQVLLGRRLHSGRYLRPRLLSRLQGGAVDTGVQGAALVAAGGKWWAVWAQGPDAGVLPLPMLFQAKTLGGAQATRQITFRADLNTFPALALTRDRHGRPSGALLAWSNGKLVPSRIEEVLVENDDIRLARAGLSGRWSSRLVSRGSYDLQVDANLAQARGTTYLAWSRELPDGDEQTRRVLVSDNPGVTPPHVFRTPGGGPKLAVKGKTVYLMWQPLDPNTIFVARRTTGAWTGQTVAVTAGPTRFQFPLLLTVTAGKLTALVLRAGIGVFAVSER
jgi:hypothetical protein